MKRVSTTLAFVLGAFATFSSAAQIQGIVTGYAPGDVDEKKKRTVLNLVLIFILILHGVWVLNSWLSRLVP